MAVRLLSRSSKPRLLSCPGAFASSPLDATLMTKLLTRGEALHSGRALAVGSDGDVFACTIDLHLWMGLERLEAERRWQLQI